jgi:hypothetical protein
MLNIRGLFARGWTPNFPIQLNEILSPEYRPGLRRIIP